MSRLLDEQRLVALLGHHQGKKLRANADRKIWTETPLPVLFYRLLEEVEELKEALDLKKDAEEIWKEAADVANFAAMIADSVSQNEHTKRRQT
jgi:NTP pyrophosphatase (non-canonical NTP hydrolase)